MTFFMCMHLDPSVLTEPLKIFVKNMLTHVHKVVYLVVSTFGQGFRRWGGVLVLLSLPPSLRVGI